MNNPYLTNLNFLSNPKVRKNWLKDFFDVPIEDFEKTLTQHPEEFWISEGEKKALAIFHAAAEEVPAYKKFLAKNKIAHEKIKTIEDFKNVPPTNKKNYIDEYPLNERCWNGSVMELSNIPAVNAGTTGALRFWPRGSFQEFESSVTHELIFKNYFEADKYSTLLVIGFPIGVYISGIATLLPSWALSNKQQYKISIGATSNNKEAVIDFIKRAVESHMDFDQIVLAGHPFFVKDFVESISAYDIKFNQDMPFKFLFASEGFTEEWRNYVLSKVNKKFSPHWAINLYGSTDLVILGHETPVSIAAKELAENNLAVRQKLFGSASSANLYQYNPLLRYAESLEDETLLFTATGGVPLIRYEIGDRGRIVPYGEIENIISPHPRTSRQQFSPKLPFILHKGRNNYVLEFYISHINPEYVRQALDKPDIFKRITGRFALRKFHDRKLNQKFEVNVELQKGCEKNAQLERTIKDSVINELRKCDYRYDVFYKSAKKFAIPKINLWPYQHDKYFKVGVKPRYIVE